MRKGRGREGRKLMPESALRIPKLVYIPSVSAPVGAPVAPAVSRHASASLLISSFSSLPGLKYGTFFGGTSTLSPVLGFRPFRGSRWRSAEAAEPAQLDLLAALEGRDDALEHGVDDHFRVLLREVGDPRDFLDELRFRHRAASHRTPVRHCGIRNSECGGDWER